jgi:hypothetical protein
MFQRDYQYGIQQQTKILPQLEGFFKDELKEATDKFAKYDYEGLTTSYELKSRNNKKDTYPTTCLPADKVCESHTKKQVYLFNFTDGLYYIPYDKGVFDTFEKKPFRRYRQGVNDKEKDYLYIPVESLRKVGEF